MFSYKGEFSAVADLQVGVECEFNSIADLKNANFFLNSLQCVCLLCTKIYQDFAGVPPVD